MMKWSVALFALLDCFRLFWELVAPRVASRRPGDRFTNSERELSPDRLALVYSFVLSIGVVYAVRATPFASHRLFVILATSVYALGAAAALSAFTLSFVGLAFPSEMADGRLANWPMRIGAAIIVLLHTVLAGTATELVLKERAELTPGLLKAVALVLVVQVTTRFLLSSASDSPLVNSLADIRRRVLLGQTLPEEALTDIEVAAQGLKASDVLQPYISALLRLQEDLRSELRAGSSEVAGLRALLAKVDGATSAEVSARRQAICRGVDARVAKLQALGTRYQQEYKEFEVRAQWLAVLSSRQQKIVAPLRAQLRSAASDVPGEANRYKQAIGDMTICEGCPARPVGATAKEMACAPEQAPVS
ncbi:MAG TPA: hypothetical protein VF871_11195 [Burkholderiales bacterium]